MTYLIEQIKEEREAFAPYRYMIVKKGKEFAIFWHNYRGKCEGIRFLTSGREEGLPFGMSSESLTGGGPEPYRLSKKAIKYLDSYTQ